jgi:cobalamin biosynthesis protein CobT
MANRNRRVRIFESAIERVARVLSRKWKVKVVFQHDRCETSGNTIYLPTLPDNASKELMDACSGHLDHETAHVVYTNFKTLKRVGRRPKTMTVLNALEDPRIEKLWIKLYPGAKLNLRRANDWSLRKVAAEREMVDPEDGVKKMMKPWDGLSNLGKFLHASIVYTVSDFDDSHWFLNSVVEPEILDDVKKYSSYFAQALDAKDTADLIPMAKELLEKLGEDDPEVEEPEQIEDPEDIPDGAQMVPGAGGAGGGGSPQRDVMTKQPKNPGPQGPPQVGLEQMMSAEEEAEKKNGKNAQQPGNSQGGRYNATDEEVENDQKLLNQGEQLRDAAREELVDNDTYLVYTTEGDEIHRVKDGDRIAYKRFMQDAVKLVAPMKRKMARSMLSTKESRWEGGKTRGKLDRRRLHAVASGTSKAVFRKRVHAEDFDTAVMLMIDHSGSMMGTQLDLAAKTAIVFGELLNQLHIPFAVYGFSTGVSAVASRRWSAASDEERRLYKRWGNLWLGEYKTWDDGWNSSGPKMINMVRNGQVNTYDGESVRVGAQMLLSRPEKRKIMFYMNDGWPCPNASDDSQAHEKYAADCAKEVEKKIELFALGIGTDAVKRFYSNCVQINKLEDLPKVCLTELDSLIRRGKSYRK